MVCSWQVSVEDAPDIKSGFKIVFTFLENRFFRNTQLEKNISYLEDGTFEISSAGPQWHAGQVTDLNLSHLPGLVGTICRHTVACFECALLAAMRASNRGCR